MPPKVQVLERHPHPKYPRLQVQLRSNSKSYQAWTFIDLRPRQQTLKTDHLPTALKLAEDWYKREVRASVAFGRQHPVGKLTTDPTMQELFASYRAELEKRKQPYADQKWSPIADFWRARLLSTVTTDTFKEFYRWRRRKDIVNHTLHKDVVLIRQVLGYAVREGMLQQLPPIPSVGTIDKNPRPWLTPEEYERLRKAAFDRILKAPNKRVRQQRQDMLDFVEFLHASMLRIGELRNLRYDECRIDVNADGNRMLLMDVKGKWGFRPGIIAKERAVEIYERRQKNPDSSGKIFPKHSRDAFRSLLEAVGLREAFGFTRNFKSMRATSISSRILEKPDLNLAVLGRNAGTSLTMIDQFYAKRLTPEMFKNQLSQLTPKERKDSRISLILKEYKRLRDAGEIDAKGRRKGKLKKK
jgi:hypothetical protein